MIEPGTLGSSPPNILLARSVQWSIHLWECGTSPLVSVICRHLNIPLRQKRGDGVRRPNAIPFCTGVDPDFETSS